MKTVDHDVGTSAVMCPEDHGQLLGGQLARTVLDAYAFVGSGAFGLLRRSVVHSGQVLPELARMTFECGVDGPP